MQVNLSDAYDHAIVVGVGRTDKTTVVLFGGGGVGSTGLDSVLQLQATTATDNARYAVASLDATGRVLDVSGTIRPLFGDSAMQPASLSNRAIQFPTRKLVRAADPKDPPRDLGKEAKQFLEDAKALYDAAVPFCDQQAERRRYTSSGYMMQMVQRPASDRTSYAHVLVDDGKGPVAVQPGEVGIGCSLVPGHADRVRRGGDPRMMAFVVDPGRVPVVNPVLKAISLLERVGAYLTWKMVGAMSAASEALAKKTDSMREGCWKFVNFVTCGAICGGGGSGCTPDLARSAHHPRADSETDFGPDGPVLLVSDVLALRVGDRLFPTKDGAQLPSQMVLLTPSQAADFIDKPSQFAGMLHVQLDTSLSTKSNGVVPVRVVAHNLNKGTTARNGTSGADKEVRLFRCARNPRRAIAMHEGPVTMSVCPSDGPLGPDVHHSSKWSGGRDFVCGVVYPRPKRGQARGPGVAYVQRDERHDNSVARSASVPAVENWTQQVATTEHALRESYADMRDLAALQCDKEFEPYPADEECSGVIGTKQRYAAADVSVLAEFGAVVAGISPCRDTAELAQRLADFEAEGKTPLQVVMARKSKELLDRSERMTRLLNEEHPEAALPRVARIEPLRVNADSDGIWKVDELHCIGSRHTANAVNGRAVLLARYPDPHNGGLDDCTVLFVDRTSACDPERKSVKMDSVDLIRRSSVRCALGQSLNDHMIIYAAYEHPVNGAGKIQTKSGGVVDTNQRTVVAVEWAEDQSAPRRTTMLEFCSANRYRYEDKVIKARTYTSQGPDGVVRTDLNPDWGLRPFYDRV
jgi:hypothetical protein